MERTNIYLDDRELAALRALSNQTGRPVAVLVREAVDAWLQGQGVSVIAEDEWSRRFGELLTRRGRLAAAEGWDPAAVEADVARAVAEAEELETCARSLTRTSGSRA